MESADGTRLSYRAWPKAGAQLTFAVVHGLGDHARRYERFAQAMTRYGFGTFAVDLRGHGKSPGRRGHVYRWSHGTADLSPLVTHGHGITVVDVVPTSPY